MGEASEDVQKAEMFCLPTDENGEVHGTGLPQWANQICSFSKAHVLKLLPQAEVVLPISHRDKDITIILLWCYEHDITYALSKQCQRHGSHD